MMEDIETLKKFIDGSGVSAEVKKALFDCVLLQVRNSPTTEFMKIVREMSGNPSSED
jgi:hypothetical protein